MGGFLKILQVAGFGGQLAGQYMADKGQRVAAKYNAKIARKKAEMTEMAMGAETTRAHKQARRMKGTQRAIASKMGADTTSGTPLLVLAEQAGEMELDVMNQRRSRMLEAQGYESEADMIKWQSKQQHRANNIGMASTLLGGASKAGTSIAAGLGSKGGKKPMMTGAQYENLFPGAF